MDGGTNLLIVGNGYRNLIKDLTFTYSDHFKEIYPLVRYNSITEVRKIIPVDCRLKKYLNIFSKELLIDTSDNPSNIHAIGTPVFYLPISSQYKKLGDKHFRASKKAIEKMNIRFDIIHSHFLWSAGYAGAKLKEEYNVPLVVTAHGYDIYDLPFRDDEWKEKIRYVLDSADHIITVSNSNLECIKKLDVKTPVKVLPNGFRKELFHQMDQEECRKSLGLPLDKKIIMTVGNLLEVKGHRYLIEAMGEVVKNRKDVLCIIVGAGKLKHKLQEHIISMGLEENVKLVGRRNHNYVPTWMNACDLFVLSSLNEGNPTVMFEALGCGKPYVGTDVGGVPEIIASDDYGLLCKPRDPVKLAENILLGLEKEWDIDKINEYAEQFTWDRIAEDTLKIYSGLL